jgi:peptide/nickel transport system substrate-binding protein
MRSRLFDWKTFVAIAAIASLVAALGCGAAEEETAPSEPAAVPAPAAPSAPAPSAPAPSAPAPAAPAPAALAPEAPVAYSGNQAELPAGQLWSFIWDGPAPTKFQENPKFAEMVKAGTLPPLEERMVHPEDTMILPGPDGVGEYGGDIRILSAGSRFYPMLKYNGGNGSGLGNDLYLLGTEMSWAFKDYQVSADGTQHTYTLRRGHRWSDGEPFTMNDVRFAWEKINVNEELNPRPHARIRDPITDEMVKFAVVDDQNFTLTYDTPNFGFRESTGNAGSSCGTYCYFSPWHHYEKMWYPELTGQDKAAYEAKMEEEGFDHWKKLWADINNQRFTVGIPMLAYSSQCEQSERQVKICANPYYYGFDPDGNQLPYWDSQTMIMLESREVAVFRALAGETDIPSPYLFWLSEIPLYAENMEKGDYSIYQWPETGGADMNTMINQDFNSDPEIGRLLRTTKFREAIAHGTNRGEYNEVLFLGFGTPQAHVPHRATAYYPGEESQLRFTTYDLAKAGQILDELGYKDTDGDGIRNRIGDLDGNTGNLAFFEEARDNALAHMELQVGQWAKMGLELTFKENRRYYDGLYQNKAYFGKRAMNAQENPWYWHILFPYRETDQLSSKMGAWLYTKGETGQDPNVPDTSYLPLAPQGNYAQDPTGVWMKMQNLWTEGKGFSRYDPRRIEIGKEIFTLSSINNPNWSTTAFAGAVAMKRNNLLGVVKRKVGSRAYFDMVYSFEGGMDNMNNPGNRSKMYTSENYFIPQ